MKPTKYPAREKKRQEKGKKRRGEKAKSKSQDCCVVSDRLTEGDRSKHV